MPHWVAQSNSRRLFEASEISERSVASSGFHGAFLDPEYILTDTDCER